MSIIFPWLIPMDRIIVLFCFFEYFWFTTKVWGWLFLYHAHRSRTMSVAMGMATPVPPMKKDALATKSGRSSATAMATRRVFNFGTCKSFSNILQFPLRAKCSHSMPQRDMVWLWVGKAVGWFPVLLQMCYPKTLYETQGCFDPYAVNCYLAAWVGSC